MPDRLEDKLAPGERVVRRSVRAHLPGRMLLIPLCAIVAAWAGFLWLAPEELREYHWLFAFLLFPLATAPLQIQLLQAAAVLTERRLLIDRGWVAVLWSWPRVDRIALAEIAEIDGRRGSLFAAPRLRLASGRVVTIALVPQAETLVDLLAEATGLPLRRDQPVPDKA